LIVTKHNSSKWS